MNEKREATVLTRPPVIEVIAEMGLNLDGVRGLARWVRDRRPDCLPEGYDPDLYSAAQDDVLKTTGVPPEAVLFPHGMRRDPDLDPSDDLGR